ncbi:hypothetical protein SLA2020_168810 [Shorea laevis]
MASNVSLYEILGIPASASSHEIKAAYRRLARICHPDVVSMSQKQFSANEFIKIQAAYSTLSDPEKRADYDRDQIYRQRRSSLKADTGAAAASFMAGNRTGYTSRNWETDQCW